MKILSSILVVLLMFYFVSCSPKYDEAVAPKELNQKTLLIKYKNKIYNGILPVNEPSELTTYILGEGNISIDGTGICTYSGSMSRKKQGWVQVSFTDIPNEELCVFNLTSYVRILDAPAIGNIIVRRFNNPNFEKLKTVIGGKTLFGVHATQIKSHEIKDINLYPKKSSGLMIVTGCAIDEETGEYKEGYFPYNKPHLKITTKELEPFIGDNIECAVDFIANNDGGLDQGSSVYISKIQDIGSDLEAPAFSSKEKDICFSFADPFVIGVYVNGKTSKLNKRKLCVSKSSKYEVIGATSKQRIFYGIHNGSKWVK